VLPARGDVTAAVSALVVGDHPEFGAELVDLVPPKPQCAQHSVGEHDGRGVRATAYFDVQAGAIAAADRAHLDRHARSGWDFVFCWFRVPASPGGSTGRDQFFEHRLPPPVCRPAGAEVRWRSSPCRGCRGDRGSSAPLCPVLEEGSSVCCLQWMWGGRLTGSRAGGVVMAPGGALLRTSHTRGT